MKIQLIAISGFGFTALAPAATLVQTINFDNLHTSPAVNVLPLTFDQFDSSLGTLTGVTLQTTGSFTRTVSVVVNGNFGSDSYKLEVDGNMRTSNVGLQINRNYSLDVTGNSSNGTIPVSYSRSFNGSNSIAPLAAHIGTGTFTFETRFIGTEIYGKTNFNNGFNAAFISQRTVGQANLTYTYDAVPEPATMSLLAIGSLAILRKKLKR